MNRIKNEFSVEMKAIGLAWPNNEPFIYGWGSGCGFGAATEAEALAQAEKFLPSEMSSARGGVCVEISRFCRTCNVTGIKPGCKRKKCPTCEGRGTVDRYGFVILKSTPPELRTLGNVIGGSSHFGHCPKCGRQHMGTHDRVYVVGHQFFCDRCPPDA